MINKLKAKLDSELIVFTEQINKKYSDAENVKIVFDTLQEYVLRNGKRVRPIMFLSAYHGFCNKSPEHLYQTALAVEILHDFMLIHDDLLDRSDMRRGKPSLHKIFEEKILEYPNKNFTGEDLALLAGDILYALAIENFLLIDEDPQNIQEALKIFAETVTRTGLGQFIEIINSAKNIEDIELEDIYSVYDKKTAFYTFVCPLLTGAKLAGASQQEQNILTEYGTALGHAFQINDDIIGIFSTEKEIGKSTVSDIAESKKTILVWHAFNNSCSTDKIELQRIFNLAQLSEDDIFSFKSIVSKTKSVEYAKEQATRFINQAREAINQSNIKDAYRDLLLSYTDKVMNM